jgi:C-terminal processing protease CtpA/Prc
VGGTAESLWRYCDGDGEATHLTDDFTGTSKSPQIYDDQYLFFLSDRAGNVNKWEVDRMNIWAMSLDDKNSLIQITDTACDFEGRTIQEYSIDAQTGNLVVRIGADLYMMEKSAIAAKLTAGNRQLGEDADDFRLLAESNSTNNGKDEGFPGNSTNITTAASIHEVVDDPVESMTHIEANDAETDVDLSVAEQAALNETVLGDGNATNATEAPKVYYKYDSIDLESRKQETFQDHHSGNSESLKKLPILVHSDFSSKQERLLPVNMNRHKTSMDIYTTVVGTTHVLMTLRGQLWVAPVVNKEGPDFTGGGMNLPPRRYRVAPGAMMGGVVRILKSMHVPNPVEDNISDRRLAVILATDPLTDTSEHAFYLVETQSGVTPMFIDLDHLPKPFVGGHLQGGSTSDGGLGSVKPDTLTISPCGRRMAWSDTDGRIVAMNLPQYQTIADRESATFIVLPDENEMGEPMVGDEVALDFSPGGRYLTVEHNARNQFTTISIVDLGDPAGKDKVADIEVTRVVQATPSRFNSFGAYWGKTPKAVQVFEEESNNAESAGTPEPKDVSTTLYFLSDRDISTDVDSPWGTRAPMPHFKSSNVAVYALPLKNVDSNGPLIDFMEGGAKELSVATELEKKRAAKRRLQERSSPLKGVYTLADNSFNGGRHLKEKTASRRIAQTNITDSIKMSDSEGTTLRNATFPLDLNIDFGPTDLTFARHAYRLPGIKEGGYIDIVCLTPEASTFVLIEDIGEESVLTVATKNKFQSDRFDITRVIPSGHQLAHYGLSTSRDTVYLGFAPDGIHVVIPNSEGGVKGFVDDSTLKSNIVDSDGLFLSVWPSLEYRQLYDDAWRMLRDYFYDPEMTGIDWPDMHKRYLPLVARCTKREELDDVLAQMASELSALHVFVYGGEYESPLHLDRSRQNANIVASLGAVLRRTPEWKGYEIMSIPERDPDFNVIDGSDTIYSPLSDKSLQLSGQRGLEVGDVIVGVNGESVMRVPDIHMLFRGMAGRSVRLDVLRLASDKNSTALTGEVEAKPLITVPLHPLKAGDLRYHAWEYKTRQMAEKLAGESGFSVGYVHLRDMSGPEAENAFARGFFPNYDKEAFILDVRHNRGGNIDSWVLDVLQRRPWMYWQSRDFNTRNGGLGWDEQFAFRGHIVVLIDEKTSSDGEGVSRGISELGLGRLIGTRTWGGGIWLSSDNHLVDGGIATVGD